MSNSLTIFCAHDFLFGFVKHRPNSRGMLVPKAGARTRRTLGGVLPIVGLDERKMIADLPPVNDRTARLPDR